MSSPALTVKLQYRNFEAGEFTKTGNRTAEETLQLIATYPWNEQRDHLAIGLTNPSVTIEGPNGDFLKLSPFYNQKLVLHYLDAGNHLYTKAFDQLSATYPFIRSLFTDEAFDISAFRKETTWLQNNAAHFRTGKFNYSFKPSRLILPSLLMLYILFLGGMLSLAIGRFSGWAGLLPLGLSLLPVSRILALAINHCRAAKGQTLIISRGIQDFSFGPAGSPATFNKNDIQEIITAGMKSKGDYPSLTRVEIRFKNGGSLDISCVMIRQQDLVAKFPGLKTSSVTEVFPFIAPGAAIPFG